MCKIAIRILSWRLGSRRDATRLGSQKRLIEITPIPFKYTHNREKNCKLARKIKGMRDGGKHRLVRLYLAQERQLKLFRDEGWVTPLYR